ncbi:hypothetical protein [Halomonas sp. BC04]|nr:hypothetical protein [Halomonas sp. BC04]EWH01702.1 hypothetical protein Q427_12770 [Halomonas sp. BC04]
MLSPLRQVHSLQSSRLPTNISMKKLAPSLLYHDVDLHVVRDKRLR